MHMTKRVLMPSLVVLTILLSALVLVTPARAADMDESPLATIATDIKSVLTRVCTDRGYGEPCVKTLLGIAWKESRNNSNAIGDGGRARGYFQIHYKMHGVSLACAQDLRCSAEWTLDYLEKNGYAKYPKYAIQCHNSCNGTNGYANGVLWHGKRIWNASEPHILALAPTQ